MKVVGGKEFFRGHKEIAGFLGVHPKTVARWIRERKIPVKRDGLGTWVLAAWDFYRELRRDDEYRKGSE
jgi:predicted site-specific integrase-resolvase